MPRKQLIVNADDFNSDPQRSAGILQAGERGIVTSTTVIANLPFDAKTITEVKSVFTQSIGIHLNVTKGMPLTDDTKTLTGPDGRFFDKQSAWKKALSKLYDPDELTRELSAQIEVLLDNGIKPDHIDSNNHLHVFPVFADIAAKLAARYKIKAVRIPRETFRFSDLDFSKTFMKKYFIYALSLMAAKFFRSAGLNSPENFNGIAFPAPMQKAAMVDFLNQLPGGTTELMCHPGFCSGTGSFATPDREIELSILTDQDIIGCIKKNNIKLISYNDINR